MTDAEDGEYIITELKFNETEAEIRLVRKLTPETNAAEIKTHPPFQLIVNWPLR